MRSAKWKRSVCRTLQSNAMKRMCWYVYVLRCRDGSLYTGVSLDPQRRLAQHNAGRGSAYVRSKGQAMLAYTERCHTRSAALRRERDIKSWRRKKKLELIGRGCDAARTTTGCAS